MESRTGAGQRCAAWPAEPWSHVELAGAVRAFVAGERRRGELE